MRKAQEAPGDAYWASRQQSGNYPERTCSR
jgi:hypothetical protein